MQISRRGPIKVLSWNLSGGLRKTTKKSLQSRQPVSRPESQTEHLPNIAPEVCTPTRLFSNFFEHAAEFGVSWWPQALWPWMGSGVCGDLLRDMFCSNSSRWGRRSLRGGEVQYGLMNNSVSSYFSSLPTTPHCYFCCYWIRIDFKYKSKPCNSGINQHVSENVHRLTPFNWTWIRLIHYNVQYSGSNFCKNMNNW